ncbi:MAG: MBL fold metallo-hydrolase [Rhodanobacter sp.]
MLIDALADDHDAQAMRRHIENDLGATVRLIVMTHGMNDHMAGLRLFPAAHILAHRYFMHTYLSQRQRSAVDDAAFVAPTIEYSGELRFRWGRHELRLFHNPGKNMSDTVVDVPASDLVFCGDALVGNIAYIGSSAPVLIDGALGRLQNLGRARVVPGHIGLLGGDAFGNARTYLHRLGEQVRALGNVSPESLQTISVESCLADGLSPRPFERKWHGRNLEVIAERRVFAVSPVRIAPGVPFFAGAFA